MTHDPISIINDGTITVDSIYQLDGVYGIESLLQECREKNCTVYFANEDLTITPADQEVTEVRAKLHAYKMVANYPMAARHYINYVLKEHNKDLR